MGGDSDVNFHLLFILVDGAVMAVVRPDWAHVMCTSVDSTAITAMAWGSILAHMLASPRQCGVVRCSITWRSSACGARQSLSQLIIA